MLGLGKTLAGSRPYDQILVSNRKVLIVTNSLTAVTDSGVWNYQPFQASLFNLAGPDLFIILFVVLLLFGAKKLPELARGLGQAVKEFSKAKDEFEREVSQPVNTQYNRLPETQSHDPHHGYASSESHVEPHVEPHVESHREEPAPVEASKPSDSTKPA